MADEIWVDLSQSKLLLHIALDGATMHWGLVEDCHVCTPKEEVR